MKTACSTTALKIVVSYSFS